MTIEDVAQVCHEVNKAYCESIGDNSQPEWDTAPLVGCGHKIKRGAVTNIYWYEEYESYEPTLDGKSWYWRYHPARYCVKIRGVKNGDTVQSTISMYKDEWDEIKIGDTLSFK